MASFTRLVPTVTLVLIFAVFPIIFVHGFHRRSNTAFFDAFMKEVVRKSWKEGKTLHLARENRKHETTKNVTTPQNNTGQTRRKTERLDVHHLLAESTVDKIQKEQKRPNVAIQQPISQVPSETTTSPQTQSTEVTVSTLEVFSPRTTRRQRKRKQRKPRISNKIRNKKRAMKRGATKTVNLLVLSGDGSGATPALTLDSEEIIESGTGPIFAATQSRDTLPVMAQTENLNLKATEAAVQQSSGTEEAVGETLDEEASGATMAPVLLDVAETVVVTPFSGTEQALVETLDGDSSGVTIIPALVETASETAAVVHPLESSPTLESFSGTEQGVAEALDDASDTTIVPALLEVPETTVAVEPSSGARETVVETDDGVTAADTTAAKAAETSLIFEPSSGTEQAVVENIDEEPSGATIVPALLDVPETVGVVQPSSGAKEVVVETVGTIGDTTIPKAAETSPTLESSSGTEQAVAEKHDGDASGATVVPTMLDGPVEQIVQIVEPSSGAKEAVDTAGDPTIPKAVETSTPLESSSGTQQAVIETFDDASGATIVPSMLEAPKITAAVEPSSGAKEIVAEIVGTTGDTTIPKAAETSPTLESSSGIEQAVVETHDGDASGATVVPTLLDVAEPAATVAPFSGTELANDGKVDGDASGATIVPAMLDGPETAPVVEPSLDAKETTVETIDMETSDATQTPVLVDGATTSAIVEPSSGDETPLTVQPPSHVEETTAITLVDEQPLPTLAPVLLHISDTTLAAQPSSDKEPTTVEPLTEDQPVGTLPKVVPGKALAPRDVSDGVNNAEVLSSVSTPFDENSKTSLHLTTPAVIGRLSTWHATPRTDIKDVYRNMSCKRPEPICCKGRDDSETCSVRVTLPRNQVAVCYCDEHCLTISDDFPTPDCCPDFLDVCSSELDIDMEKLGDNNHKPINFGHRALRTKIGNSKRTHNRPFGIRKPLAKKQTRFQKIIRAFVIGH